MREPDYILNPGTAVKTYSVLDVTTGFLVAKRHLDARRSDGQGVVVGIAAGHGGDVYFVQHDEAVAAYGFWEFDLAVGESPHG